MWLGKVCKSAHFVKHIEMILAKIKWPPIVTKRIMELITIDPAKLCQNLTSEENKYKATEESVQWVIALTS